MSCTELRLAHPSPRPTGPSSTATALKAFGLDDRMLAQLLGHRDPRSAGFSAKLDSTAQRRVLIRLRREERG